MADARPIARGYTTPVAATHFNFVVALKYDAEPVRRIKETLDINHCSVPDTLAALAFTCDPNKKTDAGTPHALHAFVPVLRSAALTAEQTESLQHALIDVLPMHLQAEIRSFSGFHKEEDTPADAQGKLASWLQTNTRPAKLIEQLLEMPDPGERLFDALDHACLNVSHESIAGFQRDLEQARSEVKFEKRPGAEPDGNAVIDSALLSMNHAVRSQLASLAGLKPHYQELLPLDLNNESGRNNVKEFLDLHRVASAVMQPLAGLGHPVAISAMKLLMIGGMPMHASLRCSRPTTPRRCSTLPGTRDRKPTLRQGSRRLSFTDWPLACLGPLRQAPSIS